MMKRMTSPMRLATIVAAVVVYVGVTKAPPLSAAKKPTPINACGTYGKGDYELDADLTAPSGTLTCLTFKRSDTTLDMKGHTLSCNPGLPFGNVLGIRALGGGSVITNGTVTNCQVGIELNGSGSHTLSNVTINNNCDGLHVESNGNVVSTNDVSGNLCGGIIIEADNNTIDGNQVSNNACHGIQIDSGGELLSQGQKVVGVVNQIVQNNTVNNNGTVGFPDCGRGIVIYDDHNGLQTLNIVQNNTATGNIVLDLEDEHVACDTNTWTGNTFGTASPASCIK